MYKYLIIVLFFSFSLELHSQIKYDNSAYKFSIELNENWKERSKEETKNNDALSLTFDKINKQKNKEASLMLIIFKLDKPKDLNDFIYTIEKDVNLNIPERVGDYVTINGNNYSGKLGEYKDNEIMEVIYYLTTQNSELKNNYAYVIRFIYELKSFKPEYKTESEDIFKNFKITL